MGLTEVSGCGIELHNLHDDLFFAVKKKILYPILLWKDLTQHSKDVLKHA